MRVTPKTDEQIEAEQDKFKPLKGIYHFDVKKAEDALSSKGNEMIKLTLGVYRPDGSELFVYDYLTDGMAFKIKHFCESTGLFQRYEAGDLNAQDCEGMSGQVELRIEKDNKGNDKSVVKDYVKRAGPANVATIAKDLNDEIPFD